MAVGKIYDSEEIIRIQDHLNAISKPMEETAKNKKDLNKKVTTGIYIISGILFLMIGINYFVKKQK